LQAAPQRSRHGDAEAVVRLAVNVFLGDTDTPSPKAFVIEAVDGTLGDGPAADAP